MLTNDEVQEIANGLGFTLVETSDVLMQGFLYEGCCFSFCVSIEKRAFDDPNICSHYLITVLAKSIYEITQKHKQLDSSHASHHSHTIN